MKSHPSRRRRGFTLIELLVVITIIVILAGLSMGGFSYIARKQAEEQTRIQISLLEKALEEYKLDNGEYPDSAGGNLALFNALYGDGAATPPTGKIYLAELDPRNNRQGWIEPTTAGGFSRLIDPFGNNYIYTRGDKQTAKNPDFDLASPGKDGRLGTPDDIDNY
jgi:type II secretion system protein G